MEPTSGQLIIWGLNFGGFQVLMQLWLDEIVALLMLINWTIAFAGLTITEAAKKAIKDNIEDHWIMIISITSCLLLAMIGAFKCGNTLAERFVTGLLTGCFIAGGYKFLFAFVSAVFEVIFGFVLKLKTNGNGKSNVEVK